jgi:MazG family protein|tara:strand:+ start:93 stop:926 length:834 start_codon:yes stop_codon:yes gene_type:complete
MKSNKNNTFSYLNDKKTNELDKLLNIMSHLRDPDKGCPWDIKQTFKSIAPYTIEEAYEVNQSIQDEDYHELKDELGDLLLQVVFLSQIAKEKHLFKFNDVVKSINKKLIRRHPHIFEKNTNIKTPDDVKNQWDRIKEKEKKEKTKNINTLSKITKNLPSIIKSQKIQEEVSKDGFDFKNVNDCILKLQEEIQEFKEALKTNDKQKYLDEGGDVLFSSINILRKAGINSQEALEYANNKFTKRYNYSEMLARKENKNFAEISLEKKHKYWLKSKKIKP